jgi:hypothetical protein
MYNKKLVYELSEFAKQYKYNLYYLSILSIAISALRHGVQNKFASIRIYDLADKRVEKKEGTIAEVEMLRDVSQTIFYGGTP